MTIDDLALMDMLRERIDPAQAAQQIKQDGIVVYPGLLATELVEALNQEFDQAFAGSFDGVSIGIHPPGRMASLIPERMKSSEFPVISGVFLNPLFKEIATHLLPSAACFHDRIALTHEYKSTSITDIHFDTRRALKFFLYLVDTDESNGAFRYARGTHSENTQYRDTFLAQSGELRNLLNVAAPDERLQLESLTAPAGTLAIFDTDMFHQGGDLSESRERKVIRTRSLYDTQPELLRHRRFSSSWWKSKIKSPEVPVRYKGRSSTAGKARAVSS